MTDSMRTNPIGKVLETLKHIHVVKDGWKACCPAHEDRNPSLSVWTNEDSSVGLKCYAGCERNAILLALNLNASDLRSSNVNSSRHLVGDRRHNSKPQINTEDSSPVPNGRTHEASAFPTLESAIKRVCESNRLAHPAREPWIYFDADGNEIGAVVRWDRPEGGKEIRPFHRTADGWHIRAMTAPRPLYQLSKVIIAKRVFVTEGEKAANALQMLYVDCSEMAVTTSAGGSNAAHQSDWSALSGKEVFIFPDNDEPGRLYADTICEQLGRLPSRPNIRIVELPGLPDRGDADDYISARAKDHSIESIRNEIERLAMDAPIFDFSPPEVPEHLGWRPFPVDALPMVLRTYAKAVSKGLDVDPSFVALPALAVCASAVGNAVRICLKNGWNEPCAVWMVLVGESGDGKSPPLQQVLKPLRAMERDAKKSYQDKWEQYQLELANHRKQLQKWERNKDDSSSPPQIPECPSETRYVADDFTMEQLAELLEANPRGLLWFRDELAGVFNSFDRYSKTRGGDASRFLELFNGDSIRVDRKTGSKSTHIPHGLMSLVGGIQPGILKSCLTREYRESGFAARILFSCPPRRIRKWNESEITSDVERPFHDLIGNLFAIPMPDELTLNLVYLDSEAKEIWTSFHDDNALERHQETGDLAAALAKLDRHGARLALVIHLIRFASNEPGVQFPTLDARSMQSGIDLARWFGNEARRVYLRISETPEECHERELVEWICSQGGTVSVRDVQRGLTRYRKCQETAEVALNQLVERNLGLWQAKPTDGIRGGRPTRFFRLNR